MPETGEMPDRCKGVIRLSHPHLLIKELIAHLEIVRHLMKALQELVDGTIARRWWQSWVFAKTAD